jgi:hypothetical protein
MSVTATKPSIFNTVDRTLSPPKKDENTEKSKYFDFLPTSGPTARPKTRLAADQGAEKHDRHQNAETLV